MVKNITENTTKEISSLSIITPLVTVVVLLVFGFSVINSLPTTSQSDNTTHNNASILQELFLGEMSGYFSTIAMIIIVMVIIGILVGVVRLFAGGKTEEDETDEELQEDYEDVFEDVLSKRKKKIEPIPKIKTLKKEHKSKDKIDFDYDKVLKDDNLGTAF